MSFRLAIVSTFLAASLGLPGLAVADDREDDLRLEVQRADPLDFMLDIDDDTWARIDKPLQRLQTARGANSPCSQLELAAGYGRVGCGTVPMAKVIRDYIDRHD